MHSDCWGVLPRPFDKAFEMLSSPTQYKRMPLDAARCCHHTNKHAGFASSERASGINPIHKNHANESCDCCQQLTTFATILVIEHYLPNKNRM